MAVTFEHETSAVPSRLSYPHGDEEDDRTMAIVSVRKQIVIDDPAGNAIELFEPRRG
jgi:hypothetical protein